MIEVTGAADDPTLRAHMPVFDATAQYPFQKNPSGQSQAAPASDQAQPQGLPAFQNLTIDMPTPVQHPYGLDSSQVGVDFVLALEHICLWHAQNPSPMLGPESGTGHHLMMIHPILAKSPPRPGLKSGQLAAPHTPMPTGMKWTVPAVELEKLLSFSEGLDLDGEITPVEAWQRLRTHPKFMTLTPTALETLRAALLTVVQCYG